MLAWTLASTSLRSSQATARQRRTDQATLYKFALRLLIHPPSFHNIHPKHLTKLIVTYSDQTQRADGKSATVSPNALAAWRPKRCMRKIKSGRVHSRSLWAVFATWFTGPA